MATFMVERYIPGVSYAQLTEAVRRTASVAAAMTAEGIPVRYLGSTFLPQEEACFCRFEGADADAVRAVNERAGAPY